jgi:hypothetical protein
VWATDTWLRIAASAKYTTQNAFSKWISQGTERRELKVSKNIRGSKK